MAGILKVEEEEVPIFCVNNFSIVDQDGRMFSNGFTIGNLVSLSDIAKTREQFPNNIQLRGEVVCPFVQKARPATNPLFSTGKPSMREKKSSNTKQTKKASPVLSTEERIAVFYSSGRVMIIGAREG